MSMGALIPLLVKTSKNLIKTLPIQCHLMFLRQKSGCLNIKRFEKLMTELIKEEGKYIHGKLKVWKERISTSFHCEDVRYDMYCNATAVLKFLKTVDIPMQKINNVTC